MGLAYCILAHKNPPQIGRLLRAIMHPDNLCILHYEKRRPRSEHEAVAALIRDHEQTYLLRPRSVAWGRFSQIGAQLECLRLALEKNSTWSHFINLTGQDFPLLPQARMVEELAANAACSFLSYFDPFSDRIWNNVEDRVRRLHIDSPTLENILAIPFLGRRLRALFGWENRMPFVPFVRRDLPQWFRYMGGANHVILSRASAVHLLSDPFAQKIIRWMECSGHPDESLFQSALLNSPLASTVVNDDRRAIFWDKAGSPSPLTLTTEHLPWLREERANGKLFARKFDSTVDNDVLCQLETDLGL